ncbi:MAG: prolipoprotein diacylglyceryl transferase [Candidatus Goldbacteria bacterium]|mgnify:CR=1 FL=1|jgi:phosphatidylglycerol:prolipoprotein diacylglycerol transferase|nr:prolipoprotein diacylglyceryl transferase [Candidatus Goldiibacteriota bacterium]HPD19105.1 prolipoprotein diacylglyceryl transferase [Candidatus Goldiibacteriota bacterium]
MFPYVYAGDIEISTHLIMIIAGILSGFLLLLYNIKDMDYKTKKSVLLFAILIFLPFFFGGWLGHVIENFISNKSACVTKNNLFWSFSLVWGFALSVIIAFPLTGLLKLNIWTAGDIFSMSIAIGGFFAKLGCFFDGCCFGIPSPENFPFGIFYPYGSYPQTLFGDVKLYPSQLFESFAWLIIFIILILRKKYKSFDGELIILLSFLFGLFRFFIEFTRFHVVKSFLSEGQIFSLIFIIIALICYILKRKPYKKLDKI